MISQALSPYFKIARPDHWFKNIFVLPGMALGFFLRPHWPGLAPVAFAAISVCMAASANYCINEYLDAPFDRLHPTKKMRPAAQGLIRLSWLRVEYLTLALLAICSGFAVNNIFGAITVFFLFMGLVYNVPPFRTKDMAYLDVISESVNNPVRLLLGFAIFVPDMAPPASFVIAYWAAGAYLMSLKRFAEIRKLRDPDVIIAYRKSLAGYNENTLLSISLFYAMTSSLFLGISLIKYKIELIILFPFLAVLFSWYFSISLKPDSVVQTPEKLYREKSFIVYVGLLVSLFCILCFTDIPGLERFMAPTRF